MCSLRILSSHFGTLPAALLAVACFATHPAHARPMLFAAAYATTGTPDAMFVAAPGATAESLSGAHLDLGDACQPLDPSMMDTATHTTAVMARDTAAFADGIALMSDLTEANYTDGWNYSFRQPWTFSRTTAISRAGTAPEGQIKAWEGTLTPGPGSACLALGAFAALAAFRLHEGVRE
jgi:hypothetical protein